MYHVNAYGLVKIKIPGLNGPRIVSGVIKRIMPNGKVEIKTQQDGYWTVEPSTILKGG